MKCNGISDSIGLISNLSDENIMAALEDILKTMRK